MRASTLLLALPALSAAQQIPFLDQVKTWLGQASKSITSVLPSASPLNIPNPIAAGAAKFAGDNVPRLTVDNYKQVLQPGAATASPGFEEWMIFVTGGNKTCFGNCQRAETAFNQSVALLSVAKNPPNLAMLNCETDGVLCNAWLVEIPGVIHMFQPQPLADQSTPSTTLRYIHVNRTSVTVGDVASIHMNEKYKLTEPYEGFFHPFNGPLAKVGLSIPFGYVLWGFSKVPSWAFMVAVSFISRTFISRRVAGPSQQRQGAAAQAPAAGQPAAR